MNRSVQLVLTCRHPTVLGALGAAILCVGCATGDHGRERSANPEEIEGTLETTPETPPEVTDFDEAQAFAQATRAIEEAEAWAADEEREVMGERDKRARERDASHEETAAQFEEAEAMVKRFRALAWRSTDTMTSDQALLEKWMLVRDLVTFYEHMYTNGSIYWESAIACRRGDLYNEYASSIVDVMGLHQLSPASVRWVVQLKLDAIAQYEKALRLADKGRLTSGNEWTRKARNRLRKLRPCHPADRSLACTNAEQ